MPKLAHLRRVIEAKSGAPTVQCAPRDIGARLGFDPAEMRRSGFDPATIELYEQFYASLQSFMVHPGFGEYLISLTPTKSYQASGLRVATLKQIRDSAFDEGSPEAELFPHGYLSIAGSVSGNSVSLHRASGNVVWADHRRPADIIAGDVPVLADDFEAFLTDLVHDRLKQRFAELD